MSGVTTATVIAGVGAAASVASTVGGMMGGSSKASAQRESADDTYEAAVRRNQQLEMQADEIKNQALQRDNQALVQDAQAHLQQGQVGMMRQEAALADNSAILTHRQADATRDRATLSEALAQRTAIESTRKSAMAAGRAKAVMGASGAGVDTTVIADILGEGNYAAEVALYDGKARAQDLKTEASLLDYEGDLTTYGANVTRYNAEVADYGVALSKWGAENTRYQATLDRRTADSLKWSGGTILQEGAAGAQALRRGADSTESTGYLKAGLSGLSIAAKYAPQFMDSGSGKNDPSVPDYYNTSTFSGGGELA